MRHSSSSIRVSEIDVNTAALDSWKAEVLLVDLHVTQFWKGVDATLARPPLQPLHVPHPCSFAEWIASEFETACKGPRRIEVAKIVLMPRASSLLGPIPIQLQDYIRIQLDGTGTWYLLWLQHAACGCIHDDVPLSFVEVVPWICLQYSFECQLLPNYLRELWLSLAS